MNRVHYMFSSLLHTFENACIKKLLEMESIICTPVFTTALCPIAKRWKQPMNPSWINGETKSGTNTQWNITQP